jgi:hypothetical protein
MELKKYWQEIASIGKDLPDFVWVMSLENKARGQVGGSIAEVNRDVAARLVHAKSHRLATEEEIAAHLKAREEARRTRFEERLRTLGISVVPISRSHS